MNAALAIGVGALILVLGLLLHRWADEPRRVALRYQMIGVLWDERERIRGYLATAHLDKWERTFFERRLLEINDNLRRLGIPRESLQ